MADEMHYASKGVGNAALATGIIGTALGVMNGGFAPFGWGTTGRSHDGYCQTFEGKVSALESEIAQLKAEKYADQVGIEVYKANTAQFAKLDDKINANLEKLYSFVIEMDKRTALNAQALEYENKLMDCKVSRNKEIGELSDAAIISYINSNFLPGTLKLPITSICPQPATPNAQEANLWIF